MFGLVQDRISWNLSILGGFPDLGVGFGGFWWDFPF